MSKKNVSEIGTGKSVLVTGAGGGLGIAVCELLIERGYKVYGVIRRDPKTVVEGVNYLRFDVTDMESMQKVFDEKKDEIGSLYGIVHTAGIYKMDSLVEIDEKDMLGIFNINVFGAYRVNKVFLPLLEKGGRIVLTSSELGAVDPLPFTGLYGITKTTLERYAFSLRQELNLIGRKVSIVRPGAIETPLLGVSTNSIDGFKKKTQLYKENATKFDDLVNAIESHGVSPRAVGMKCIHGLEDKNPKYIYNINRTPYLKMLSILPDHLQVAILGMMLGKQK